MSCLDREINPAPERLSNLLKGTPLRTRDEICSKPMLNLEMLWSVLGDESSCPLPSPHSPPPHTRMIRAETSPFPRPSGTPGIMEN